MPRPWILSSEKQVKTQPDGRRLRTEQVSEQDLLFTNQHLLWTIMQQSYTLLQILQTEPTYLCMCICACACSIALIRQHFLLIAVLCLIVNISVCCLLDYLKLS